MDLKLNSTAQIMINYEFIQGAISQKWTWKNIYKKLLNEKKYSYSYSTFTRGLKKILEEEEQKQNAGTCKRVNQTKGFYAEPNPDKNKLV